jgi:SAM-dependent methyltransferase
VSFYEERLLPRIIDVVLGPSFDCTRARVADGLRGGVIEIGFGSGRNVPHYPTEVTRVWAVDPALAGRRLAAPRVAARRLPVEYVGLDGQDLPLEDSTCDHALVTWTLCTIPDVGRALAELRRVLKPGGTVHFVEHGRSAEPAVARWQERLGPLWGHVSGGCHLDRAIDELLVGAGFDISRLDRYVASRPQVFGTFYEGVAISG